MKMTLEIAKAITATPSIYKAESVAEANKVVARWAEIQAEKVVPNAERLEELTKAITAFKDWADFRFSMTEHGYVPTLQKAPGQSKWAKEQTAKVIELRALLVAEGFRVFPETLR